MREAFPLPTAFAAHMREQLASDADAYFASLESPYLRGFRINPRKPVSELSSLIDGLEDPIPWWNGGFELSQESTAGANPLHEAGAYYLQEPSAMAPVHVLAPKAGERVLDLCAAPGGKSTQIADALGGDGLLVCNELVPSRARILSRNVERMGITNALVVSAEPEQLCQQWACAFDAILIDAPCSGEGMFRRHLEARAQWDENTPAGCAARQKRILACALRMLKTNGRLCYSTCTFNREENEQVIAHLLKNEAGLESVPFSLPIGQGQSLDAPNGTLHLYPHETRGEGHFVALLRKTMEDATDNAAQARTTAFLPAATRLQPPTKPLLSAYAVFASSLGDASLPIANAQLGGALLCAPLLPPLTGIKVLRAGLRLGVLNGKVFTPDHALAMGLTLPYALPMFPLDGKQARAYQGGETLPIPDGIHGYVLVAYQGLALGFGKASNGTLKNHYPKGLRRP